MEKAVFLDRDGTINIDKGYVYKIEDMEFIDKAPEAIAAMKRKGYLVVVLSNQSGVARGYYGEEDVNKLHCEMNRRLEVFGAHIDKFYFCPHHPDGCVERYSYYCSCRKPCTGMLNRAVKELSIDMNKSWVVGDRERDLFLEYDMPIKRILLAHAKGLILKDAYEIRNNLWDFVQKDL